jgi:hypothetical protein
MRRHLVLVKPRPRPSHELRGLVLMVGSLLLLLAVGYFARS